MATILVAEDYQPNRELLVTVLGYAGHQVLEAADGQAALAMVHDHRPDLAIVDVLMPTMDGFEFVHQLRQSGDAATTPVIFYTATYHQQEALRLAERCGVSRIMYKPCDPITILDTVNAVLNERGVATPPVPPEMFRREHAEVVSQNLLQKAAELDAASERLAAVVELSQQLASETRVLALIERCCRGARELLGARYAVLGILALSDGTVAHQCVRGLPEAEMASLETHGELAPVLAAVMRERRAVRLRTTDDDPGSIGLPSGHPALTAFLGIPISSPTVVYGWLYFADRLCADFFTDEDARIATMLGQQLGVAYENLKRFGQLEEHTWKLEREVTERQRIEQELRISGERLRALSERLLTAQELERRTIARELHDEIGQALTALTLNLGNVDRTTDEEAKQRLIAESVRIAEHTLEVTRDLSVALRPRMLDDLGLVPALRWYVDQQAGRAGFDAGFRADVDDAEVPPELATACFRIAQEALTNVARHARTKTVSTAVSVQDGQLNLVIEDHGAGFDVGDALERAMRGESSGILLMQERAALFGGAVKIESAAGRGTTLTARLPLLQSVREDMNDTAPD